VSDAGQRTITPMTTTYALAAPGSGPALFAAGTCGVIVVVMIAVAAAPRPSMFIDTATARKFALTMAVLLPLFICVVSLPPYFVRIALDDHRIAVTAWWERASIPRMQLRADAARIVDVESDTALGLAARTGGTAEPGYRDGYFRLRNGARALVYITDPSRVIAIPVRTAESSDEWLLLSVERPESLLVELHRQSAPRQP